ncbi:hypothetical protein [Streptomyces chattanoogensis]|uniref:Uncharacterized protein n=1 Tax=Streptomyces chattanoogensis TaxID=66876 RepID=A0A0N0GVI7_9ACTN|nr:hypothetical protein [Streptomyces chattanoogensis]KPC58970.1 hypothetical protein ADL29_38070 [Streptomyces chattanoogensis]
MDERDRKELREWIEEWRYWLGGAVILSAIWGVQCFRRGEQRFYWPLTPLAVWAAVLIAVAVWPRGGEPDDSWPGPVRGVRARPLPRQMNSR